ncbi:TIGR03013 family XrtA/PEP-CTERM system glycosyltransferase [Marinimicrobium sp. ARAG 43.8]|uniref:TIGR03013 family XrtA/PEP-CTERM system glycosyltransferase n=1 Tax=Marinimicrobium sp. ARAG 43.8 TaxID=3418719 RepID=UPI003CF5660D
MSYIRINKHYVHLPYLFLGLVELVLLVAAVWLMDRWLATMGELSVGFLSGPELWWPLLLFAVVLSCCTLSMGVYTALVREGYSSMVLRTLVSFFLLGSAALFVIDLMAGAFTQALIFWSILLSTAMVLVSRAVFLLLVDTDELRRRVVIFGAGVRAQRLLSQLAPEQNVVGVKVIGCVPSGNEPVAVDENLVLPVPQDWVQFARSHQVSEIVIAPDERRQRDGGLFPLAAFVDCKLHGTPSSDTLGFCERELGKIDVEALKPGWMLFSDGFKYSRSRSVAKRLFDLGLASLFILILWPFMLLTAIAVLLESGRPVLYHQERVGLNGRCFRIYKFRSMRQDAEKGGKAVWAQKNDSRITRVGAFIRNTRLDELPQLYNVIRGDMSFVGPRPERPEFVKDLSDQIPFYDMRHKVKPGLMGWAQLKYPYGASVEDARGKLQYDLYYTKNHSFLMDMLIMIQTVEIVLLGKGVH